jgi:gentisate 1,2-dioxygenase
MNMKTKSLVDLAAENSLLPLWDVFDSIILNEPTPGCGVAHWDYQNVQKLLRRAAAEISTEEAERRVLLFNNPTIDLPFTTHTLAAGMQILLKDEIEGSHRHTQTALRLVVEGSGGYTTTDGEKIWMNPGDVITTPSWTWHDHGKVTDGDLIWFDGIDLPLVNHMKLTFSEFMNEGDRRQKLTKADSDSHYRYGSGFLPINGIPNNSYSPIYSYPYERTREVLEKLRRFEEWNPQHALKIKLSNPLTGDHFLPTIAGFMQLIPAGFETESYRSTEVSIVNVVEGRGTAKIGDTVVSWNKGDVFVIPNWTHYTLSSSVDAVLFYMSDRAAQEKLGLWRES